MTFHIGENIKKLRSERGVTQEQLGDCWARNFAVASALV